jgi:hypothetical protein
LLLQAQAFVLALLRFFIIGMFELNSQFSLVTGNKDTNLMWTSCFSFLLFGQVIDNMTSIKKLFLGFEIILTFWILLMAIVLLVDGNEKESGSHMSFTITNQAFYPMNYFLVASFQIVQTI